MAALVLDRTIVQQVIQRLTMRGLSAPCKIEVQSRNGEVTLTGPIQHAHQRATAKQAAATATGVRNVVDRLTLKLLAKRQ
jgi:osmotically-inducible protein OsmY